ncbi:MAG TPA: hypothetical protein ACFYD2_06000 [Candidatus Avalokitesvara rifleensis]|nr:hypothetical protein [Candidatus Brocadiales bacterium]
MAERDKEPKKPVPLPELPKPYPTRSADKASPLPKGGSEWEKNIRKK